MKSSVFFAAVLAVSIYSCEKEKSNEENFIQPEQVTHTKTVEIIGDYETNMENCVISDSVIYYLDGEVVEAGTFDPGNEELYLFVRGNEADATSNIMAFTTEDRLFAYGDDNDIRIRDLYAVEEEITRYIADNRIIETWEETGEISGELESYSDDIAERYFPGSTEERGLINLYKDFWGGSSWIHGTFSPVLMLTYNNRVSRYFDFSIYGFVNVYDWRFFRRRLATLWGWGWTNVRFNNQWGLGFLNDRMSSQINL